MKHKIKKYNLILLVAFLIGFTGLCYEIAATKVLFYFFSESSISVATVISIFLFGLGLGSLLFSFFIPKIKKIQEFIFKTQFAIACYAIIFFSNFEIIPTIFNFINSTNTSLQWTLFCKFFVSFLYLIFPTLLIGISMPALLTLLLDYNEKIAQKISIVYSLDLMGAVIGALISGYIFIPFLGIKALIFITAAINLLTGLIMIIENKNKLIISSILSIIILLTSFTFINPFYDNNLVYKTSSNELGLLSATNYKKISKFETIFSSNSPYGQVSIVQEKKDCDKTFLSLYINNRIECTTTQNDVEDVNKADISEIQFAIDSIKEMNKNNLKVLNIGLGCGFTLNTLAQNKKVKTIDIIEINPEIVKANKYFNKYNKDVLNNPKVKLTINDGFYHLFNKTNKYDIIIVDIENPSIIESTKLYTQDFYNLVEKSLTPNGIFALWAYVPRPNIQVINYNTLKSVFPYVTLKISGKGNDIYFFAKNTPIKNIQLGAYDKQFLKDIKETSINIKKINTLNNSTLSTEWIKTGGLATDKY